MRTHESVLRANYKVAEEAETKSHGAYPSGTISFAHARKFLLAGEEVMERRMIVHIQADGQTASVAQQYNALGSFHQNASIDITKEQFEYLKEVWK